MLQINLSRRVRDYKVMSSYLLSAYYKVYQEFVFFAPVGHLNGLNPLHLVRKVRNTVSEVNPAIKYVERFYDNLKSLMDLPQ